jgi:formylglycine-generating enzyme required for sulfatase activity
VEVATIAAMRIPAKAAALALLLLAWSPSAVLAQKAADVAQKEEAFATAKKTFGDAERGIRSSYEERERALLAARAEQGTTWRAEMRRVLEGLSAAAVAAVQKKGSRAQIQGLFKREGPVALKKIENKDLLLFEPILAGRLAVVGNEVPLDAAKLEAGNLADLVLAEILGEKPFHEYWNDALAEASPVAESYRKAAEALNKAKWDLDVAKDPVLQWQRGAPAGFARVPAGTYFALGSSGFGAQGSRKGKKPVTLSHDVFISLREVTHGEFFEWWKGLDAEAKKKHAPIDQGAQQPLWPTPEGASAPELPEELRNKPVTGVSLATALLYAASRGARVPSETEWCAAAGGREGRLYPWGDAWQAGQCNDVEHKVNDALPVGTMPGRGPFGHYDLAGNVAEWTATYEAGKDVDPAKLEDANAVVRGGSYAGAKDEVSNGWIWYRRAQFDRLRELGFRLAIDKK